MTDRILQLTAKAPPLAFANQDAHLLVPSQPDDVVWVIDQAGTPLSVDDRIYDLLGYWADEVLERDASLESLWWRRVHPDDRARVEAAHTSMFELARAFEVEYRVQRRDGRWIWVDARAVALTRWEGGFCAHVVMRSASARRKEEGRARRAIASYREVCATAPAVVVRRCRSQDYGLCFVSPNVTVLLGYTRAELLHSAAFVGRLVHADDRAAVHGAIRRAVASGSSRCEYRVLHKAGGHQWIRETTYATRFDGPIPAELVSYWSLIAEERRWEQASRRLETALQVLGARAADAIAVCEGNAIVRANGALLEALGRASADVVGRDPRELVDRRDRPALDALLGEEAGSPGPQRTADVRWVHASGETTSLRCSTLLVQHEGEPAVLLIGARS